MNAITSSFVSYQQNANHFEVMRWDFIIDEDMKVYLLEVGTDVLNYCLLQKEEE